MKKAIVLLCLLLSGLVYAEERELHFAPETERTCRKEVMTLGCGVPSAQNAHAFMECVDQKISSLSPDCQVFHQYVRKGHKH